MIIDKNTTCPECGFDYKSLQLENKIIVCPKCQKTCADVSNPNFIRIIDGLIPQSKKKNLNK